MNIFTKKPKFTVEQIHREIDEAPVKRLEILKEAASGINISNELPLLREKVKKLKDLGFTNSEEIKKLEDMEANLKELMKPSTELERHIAFHSRFINYKVLKLEDFNKICEKYELIYAPIENYIKEVPEKNLNEMINFKKSLSEADLRQFKPDSFVITSFKTTETKYYSQITRNRSEIIEKVIKDVIKNNFSFDFSNIKRYLKDSGEIYSFENNDFIDKIGELLKEKYPDDLKEIESLHNYVKTISFSKINYGSFFISAPESHFNLKGLNRNSKYSFLQFGKSVTVNKKKDDPIVFRYLKDDYILIVTKWGTEDDQSYIDPVVINNIMN